MSGIKIDAAVWLRTMFRKELDLRPPSLAKINENSVVIYDSHSIPIGHVTRINRWGAMRLTVSS